MSKLNLNRTSGRVLASLVLLFSLAIGNAWAGGDKYYAKITITTNPATGVGKVYAKGDNPTDSPAYEADTYTAQNYEGSASVNTKFYGYAKPTRGYIFDHWNNAGTESTDMPLEFYRTTSATKDEGNAIQYNDLVAYFSVNPPVSGGITYNASTNGSYSVDYDELPAAEDPVVPVANFLTYNTDVITLTATPASGYSFRGWRVNDEIVSYKNPWITSFTSAATVQAVFTNEEAVFLMDQATFSSWSAALAAANSVAATNPMIIPLKDYVIPAGDYTINAGVSLLIPFKDTDYSQQFLNYLADYNYNAVTTEGGLSPYRTLTLAEGVNIICNGIICAGGQIMSGAEGNAKSGYPVGPCGMIDMSHGGHIELNNGAVLYAYGMIKGQDRDQGNNTIDVGTITAHDGSIIWEDFQVGDFRGGSACRDFYNNRSTRRFFPFQSYNICNIEVPITYHFGATEKCITNLYASSSKNGTTFTLVGKESTLFLLQDENSLLRKWYDPTTDLMCYEMSGTTQLDAIQMYVIIVNINSGDFLLPIASNMKIIMTNTNMTLSKPIAIHAGAQLEIKSDANVTIDAEVYMFDNDQWGKWVKNTYFRNLSGLSAHKYRGDGSDKTLLDDAKLIVDGTLTVSSTGKIYSTASGADVMGNGGGSITFNNASFSAKDIYMSRFTNAADQWDTIPFAAANLCNEDGSYTKSIMGSTFHNVHGRWFVDGKQNEKADHTYDFTYMADGNSGEDVNTLSVYSKDKTGLEERFKWANVTQDATCPDNYNAADDIIYNYTKNNTWIQFIPDEREFGYSGSDNKLYTLDGCTFTDPVAIDDETCLYPFTDGNKALVNGKFIALTPNAYDAAYKDANDKYYICFKGCNWHEATPYEGELKTYNVVEGGTYIWFDGDWLAVQREAPFFYTEDAQTNVKTYYEYKDGEWIIATPYVLVIDASETRELFSLADAFTIASAKKDATIQLNRDFSSTTIPFSYTGASTNCTLDLNGHVATIKVIASGTAADVNMVSINGASSTFTITDNSGYGTGVLRLLDSVTTTTNTKRWNGIYIKDGKLELNAGKIYVENAFKYTSTSNTGIASAITVEAGKTFTMNGGEVEARSPYSVRGIDIHGTSTTSTLAEIKGGVVSATTTKATHAIGIYIQGGQAKVSGGTINATTETTTSRGIYVEASTSPYYGTLTMTGGTVNVIAKTTTAIGVFVQGTHTMKNQKPNTIKNSYLGVANISGGTFNVESKGSGTTNNTYGIQSLGTVTISGSAVFLITSKGTTTYGLYAQDGTTTFNGAPSFTVKATTIAQMIYANGAQPVDKSGRPYNPKVIVNGGTFNVETTTGTNARGIRVDGNTRAITSTAKDNYAGNYASAGDVTVNDGVFTIYSNTTDAFGFTATAAATQSGAEGYAVATSTPKVTINGGKFKVTSGTANNGKATNSSTVAEIKVNGGYYNYTNAGLLADFASPKQIITLTNASGNCPDENYPEYKYKIAEAYLITFVNGETSLQSTLQNAGAAAVYNGLEPQKADDGDNSYEFDGWATEADGDVAYAKGTALPNVSAEVTYYAHFATTAKKYIITWNANGGECATELTRVDATGSATIGTLPPASKTGHDFAGWFTSAEGGNQVTTSTIVTGHVEYFAHYTVHSHTLTWNANGGSISGTYTNGSVNYGAAITAPANANVTRTGYTFAGWNATPAATMPDNDLTYTAQWTANTNTAYQVTHKKQNPENLAEYTIEETENKTGTTATYVTPATKSYTGWKTPATQTKQIAADGSMEVTYLYDCITYDIAFDATTNGGTCSASPITNIVYGHTIGSRIAALPTEPEVSKEGNDFVGWFTKPVGGEAVTLAMEVRYNVGAIYAQFRAKPQIEVGEDGAETFDVTNKSTVDNVIVHTAGKLIISTPSPLTTTNLILEATTDVSGEIIGNVSATNAYFDLTLNTERRRWYAVAVPWKVNAETGISIKGGRQLVLGRDFDLVYYNGETRAERGPGAHCWTYVEDETDKIMKPGRAYMMYFAKEGWGTIRFACAEGTFNDGDVNSVAPHAESTGNDGKDANWNGIANPALYHAKLSAGGATYGYVLNNGKVDEYHAHTGDPTYSLVPLSSTTTVVGKALFIQAVSSGSIVATGSGASGAPRRMLEVENNEPTDNINTVYEVTIQAEDNTGKDNMFIQTADQKEPKYTIGQDLLKAGVNANFTQMWINRYDSRLAVNTAEESNGTCVYPLGINIPQAGNYAIAIENAHGEEGTLYLTLNEKPIWNLNYGAYIASFEVGETDNYGLRFVKRAPGVATGFENMMNANEAKVQKVLIDNQVYIIRNGAVYGVDGRVVK